MPSAPSLDPLTLAPGTGRPYTIHFRPLDDVPALMEAAGLQRRRCVLVTDENVADHYRRPLKEALRRAGWQTRTLVISPGEASKSAAALQRIYDTALGWGIDRETPVLALGGGVVGDLAGFAAATLLRGVPLVHLPTSLLAQVDSSIGGKTGINHATGKNLIGTFYQPTLVVTDVQTTETLPQREWISGLAEVLKHALIAAPELFAFLEKHLPIIAAQRPSELISPMIRKAAQVKVDVVSEDVHEQGRRAILNFGHTFGHALEREAGYGVFTHGEAVALGMRAGLYLSHQQQPSFPLERTDALVRALPLQGDPSTLSMETLRNAMQSDKKNREGTVRIVLLDAIGHAFVSDAPPTPALHAAWEFAKSVRT